MSSSLSRLSKWIRSVELKNEKEFVEELDLNMLWMAWDIQNLIDLIYTAEAIVHRYLENDHHEVLVGIDEFKLKLKRIGRRCDWAKVRESEAGMSIYPVRINQWYVKDKPFGKEVESLEGMLPHLKCEECKKPITWNEGYVMHSITYGGPDEAWCSALCLYGEIYEAKADINLIHPNLD